MEVAFKNIKVGETYGIKYYRGINEKLIGTCLLNRGSFGLFNVKIRYYWKNEKRSIDNQTIYYANVGYRFFLLGQKEKIQEAMELRAYTKIMKKLLGHSI
jgi:hypothetical protein